MAANVAAKQLIIIRLMIFNVILGKRILKISTKEAIASIT